MAVPKYITIKLVTKAILKKGFIKVCPTRKSFSESIEIIDGKAYLFFNMLNDSTAAVKTKLSDSVLTSFQEAV